MNINILTNPLEMIIVYVFLVLSFGLHEAAHAKVAVLFGDVQPEKDGVDTWNPVTHLKRSLLASVIIPAFTWFVLNFFIGGAFTRLNPLNLKPRRLGYAAAVASGPLANLALAILAGGLAVLLAFLIKKKESSSVTVFILVGCFNFFGFVINLLPLPPFDGAHLIRAVFPSSERFYEMIQGLPVLMLFFLSFPSIYPVLLFPIKLYYDVVIDLIHALGI